MKQFDTVEKALDELKQGHLILVTDDEDRENEGDLICAASFATTENVNFMATHAKGLICMPMSAEICRKLQFPQMVMDNTDNHETAFTVSIDHKTTTTGISAEERGITARACVDPGHKAGGFPPPGTYVSADGEEKRHSGAQRSHRGDGRPDAACRVAGMRSVLRDHARGWNDDAVGRIICDGRTMGSGDDFH